LKYSIAFHPTAQKNLEKLSSEYYEKVREKIYALQEDPRPTGVTKLKGRKISWRIRIGTYRVVFCIDDTAQEVYITSIGHRRQVYR